MILTNEEYARRVKKYFKTLYELETESKRISQKIKKIKYEIVLLNKTELD